MRNLFYLIALSTVITTVKSQDPNVIITKTEPDRIRGFIIWGQRDKDVTIWCHVENLPKKSFVEFVKTTVDKNGNLETTYLSKDERPNDNTKFAIEKPKDFTWRLRIKSIQNIDNGNYTCQVQTTEYDYSQANVTVFVYSKPEFVEGEMTVDVSYNEGDNVILKCITIGTPTPYVEWTRVGNALLPIGRERLNKPVLQIESLKPEDRGLYRCRSWNLMGTIYRDVNVKLDFIPQIVVQNPILKQKQGYVIELQCLAILKPYPSEDALNNAVYWRRDDGRMFTFSSDRYIVKKIRGAFNQYIFELIINGVTDEDYGTYTCYIGNTKGTSHKEVQLHSSDVPMPSIKKGKILNSTTILSSNFLILIVLTLIDIIYINVL